MEVYCSKCKSKTDNVESSVSQDKKGRWKISAKCIICGTNKSSFLSQERVIKLANELHKPVRKTFIKRQIYTPGIDDLWAADLIIMKKYSTENEGNCYMFNIIDTFSKFAWSIPLKTKDGYTVSKAFENIIKKAKSDGHNPPNLLHTDKGTEFRNKQFKEILQKYNIKMYHTENEEKSAIIERFNRTLNQKMKIQFEIRGNKKWIDILDNLLQEYNFSDVHRSIKMKPSEVNKDNENTIFHTLFPTIGNATNAIKLKIGDRVRITKFKHKFHNKYDPNWTREVFTINKILQTNPVTYKIKDSNNEIIEGSFYNLELQKSEF
jgi:transposase InsO family protein